MTPGFKFVMALLVAGTLLVALGGCAAPVVVVQAHPPLSLLLDCEHPSMRVGTNGEMAETLLAYKGALSKCNNDKASLREWERSLDKE